ncbi:hypothetical protein FisN_21Lu122 [Fistulifera solaris]|uniref:Fe2OG dioxygenase domain-containing protein n=1 Tax=Fistulifera solaris TaxID=1519565 RepID=A0A1Z5J8V5_FISSO|nr:hypothetical protein FisN_21Lu122 [Fistulifera solaris]|eukprot:GAX10420.1 hypothetical protein FisN_21Lu122 [Fistulifera solaris]
MFFILFFFVTPLAFSFLLPHRTKLLRRNDQSPWKAATTSIQTNISITLPSAVQVYDDYPSALHTIHVKTVLTPKETEQCLRIATEYATLTGRWDRPDFTRHASYATCDFCIEDCPPLQSYLQSIHFDTRIWDLLHSFYNIDHDDMSYLDFFCAHYRAKSDENLETMDRLEAHRDGSLLSFTLLLTPPDRFEGGGTFFEALRDVEPTMENKDTFQTGEVIRPQQAGDAVMHCGKILHGADVITKGQRTVLVGFVDVSEWRQRPGALSRACRDWGRMDVAKRRLERQKQKGCRGWFLNHQKWLPKVDRMTHSIIQGYIPAFRSVERRGNDDFQRRKRLEAEDVLLRTILMDRDEAEKSFDIFDGDVTIL